MFVELIKVGDKDRKMTSITDVKSKIIDISSIARDNESTNNNEEFINKNKEPPTYFKSRDVIKLTISKLG